MTKPKHEPLTAVPGEVAELGRVRSADERVTLLIEQELSTLRAREAARETLARERAEDAMRRAVGDAVNGTEFLFSAPEPDPVWGRGSEVLWAAGEALMVAGPPGVGKSTLAQRLVLARIGYADEGALLGYPVEPDERPVVYLAMDRVAQIRRSIKRMIDPDDPRSRIVSERLAVYPGSPPFNAADAPELFAEWVVEVSKFTTGAEPGTVVVDSYKDLAPNLNEDRAGSGLNRAAQILVNSGVEWLGIHHVKKPTADNKKLTKLSDVYGSTWLTAGAGSVLILEGDPGTSGAELHHAKQPAEAVGPLVIRHDHATGETDPVNPREALWAHLREMGQAGVTKRSAAEAMFGTATDATRKRAERELGALVEQGGVSKLGGTSGGTGGGTESRWVLARTKVKVFSESGAADTKTSAAATTPESATAEPNEPPGGASDATGESVGRASDAEGVGTDEK